MHHLPPPSRSALVAELGRVSHSQYVFDLQFTLYGVLGAPIVSRLGGLGPDATSDGITSVRRACTFAEFETLVAPLEVRPDRMIPTAMSKTLGLLSSPAE